MTLPRLLRMPALSIRAWMVVVSLVAALPLLMLLLGVTAWRLEVQAQQRQASLQRQALRIAEVVSGVLARQQARLQALAALMPLHQDQLPVLHETLVRVATTDTDIASISLIDAQGRRLADNRLPFGLALPDAGTPELTRAVIAEGRPAVSPLVVGAVSRRAVVGVAVPVPRLPGQVPWLLRLTMNAEVFSSLLEYELVPQGWIVAVVDQQGVILARNVDAARRVGQAATPSLRAFIASGAHGVTQTLSRDGQSVLTAVASVAGSGWHLAVGAPEEAIERSERQTLLTVLLLGSGLALLSAGLSFALGQRVALAVRRVASGTEAEADGGIAELARIRERFDHARAELHSREAALQGARLDALTHLPARAAFIDEASRRLASLDPGECLGLLFIDLDGFKAVNDAHGHDAGDRALVAVADLLRHLLRPDDLPARLGGDEFVVALVAPQAHGAEVCRQVAQRIVERVALLGQGLGCSVGLAMAAPEEPLASVLERADQAMLTAKRSGKNRVHVA